VRRLASWLLQRFLPGAVGLVTFVLLWQFAIWALDLPPFLLPGPGRVFATAYERADVLFTAVWLTACAALGGLAGSLLLGMFLAVLFSQSRFVERSFYPYAIFLQTVPVVAISPILLVLSGHGFHTIVLIAGVIGLFPILASGTVGLRAVHPSLLDLFRLHRASRWQVLWKLQLPTAVPYFVTGTRTASGLAILGAIVGETFTAFGDNGAGLGYLTTVTFQQQQTAFLYAVALASAALGIAFFVLIGSIERVFLRKWSSTSE
jgi:NitT/TauT family transport system permease protein